MDKRRLTPGKVSASSQPLSSREWVSGWWAGFGWTLELVLKTMTKLETTKGFNSQRNLRVTSKLREMVEAAVTSDFRRRLLLSLLDPPRDLPAQTAASLYNSLVRLVLEESRALEKRQEQITLGRGRLAIPGFEMCGNPTCARLFESSGESDGLCSQKCRKSANNRSGWQRRGKPLERK